MHIFWLGLRFSAAPLTVLNAILLVARPKVLPYISTGSAQARFLYVLAQMLHTNVVDIPEGWEGEPPVRPAGDPLFPLAHSECRDLILGASVGLLDILAHGHDGTTHDHVAFFAGHERPAFHAIFAALRDDKELRECPAPLEALLRFAGYLFKKLDLPPSFYDGVLQERPPPDVSAADANYAKAVQHHLILLCKQRGCSSPGCGKTVHDNGGRPFPTCANCKAVQYCSRACQQRDWKTGQYRHKDICPLLCRLLAEASIEMGLQEFARAFEHALPDQMGERIPLWQWAFCAGLLHGEEESQALKRQFKVINDCLDDMNEDLDGLVRELTGKEDVEALTQDEKMAILREYPDEPIPERLRNKYMWQSASDITAATNSGE
ncbi:hypothetical protein AURDEDRAFT_162347 [Auricularia subglabra TFB-10046 SS5]|nr:hypothetical protein AURDEDRAFT_162347 [Auricularia subglabra TFB-10046 SS5]